MESAVTLNTVDRAEQVLLDNEPAAALELVRSLYGQVLPSSERGRALAIEVVSLERLGRNDEVEQLVVDVMKEEGDDHAYILSAGVEFSELEAPLHAEVFLRNLCELDPNNSLAWFNLAIALGREDRYVEAVQAYDRCIAATPEFADAYRQRAYCQETLEDLPAAATTYRRYLELRPDDAEAWKSLAIVESDQRRFTEAYDAFRQALQHATEPEDVYFNWAITAVRNSDTEQQLVCIDRLQDLDPDGWRTLLTRADREENDGQIWAAWELLREAFENVLEVDPEEEPDVDEDASGYVASVLLRFAYRHDMREHANEAVLRIFEEELFTEDVLDALQALEGRFSNTATSFQVVVRRKDDGTDKYVVYGVSADNADEAGRLAISFEERCDAELQLSLYAIHQLTTPDEGRIGVYWRSGTMDAPPAA